MIPRLPRDEIGEYPYEKEVFDFLEDETRFRIYFDVLCEIPNAREDAYAILMGRFGFTESEAKLRLDAYMAWVGETFSFKCEKCGFEIRAGHRTCMEGCSCGAIYIIDGWGKYHRDDTGGGTVEREMHGGREFVTIRL